MKTLMLGNEAAARGLFEAGCSFVSSYPGTPSTEITECAAKYPEIYAEWAPNEKVAMEAAFGASLSGRRSFCGMKHVGLNVAADPLFTLSYTGVRGGMVIGVADDAGMHSSQNEQDSRHYAIAAKLPMLEPSDAAESLAFAKLAYELSEKFDTPVLLKMCTRVAHAQSVVETSERQEVAPIPYEKDIAKFVMMPACARARHPIVEQRTLALQAWAETADVNRVEDGADHSIGLISSSTSYQYVKEVCGDKYPVLKLGMIHPCRSKRSARSQRAWRKSSSWRSSTASLRRTAAPSASRTSPARSCSAASASSARTTLPKSLVWLSTPVTSWTSPSRPGRRSCARAARTEGFSIRSGRTS